MSVNYFTSLNKENRCIHSIWEMLYVSTPIVVGHFLQECCEIAFICVLSIVVLTCPEVNVHVCVSEHQLF